MLVPFAVVFPFHLLPFQGNLDGIGLDPCMNLLHLNFGKQFLRGFLRFLGWRRFVGRRVGEELGNIHISGKFDHPGKGVVVVLDVDQGVFDSDRLDDLFLLLRDHRKDLQFALGIAIAESDVDCHIHRGIPCPRIHRNELPPEADHPGLVLVLHDEGKDSFHQGLDCTLGKDPGDHFDFRLGCRDRRCHGSTGRTLQ